MRLHGRNYDEWFKDKAEGGSVEQRYNYLYPVKELEPWAQRIRKVAEGTGSTFVVTNNHFGGKAVANALQILHLLTRKPVRVPPSMFPHFPELTPIAVEREAPASLF